MANVIWAGKAGVNSDGSSGFMRTHSVGGGGGKGEHKRLS